MSILGKSVVSELVPLPEFVKNLAGRISQASIELVFLASQLPPLGSRSFHISSSMIDSRLSSTVGLNETLTSEDLIISNKVKNTWPHSIIEKSNVFE